MQQHFELLRPFPSLSTVSSVHRTRGRGCKRSVYTEGSSLASSCCSIVIEPWDGAASLFNPEVIIRIFVS
jgi:hypothetical protein